MRKTFTTLALIALSFALVALSDKASSSPVEPVPMPTSPYSKWDRNALDILVTGINHTAEVAAKETKQ